MQVCNTIGKLLKESLLFRVMLIVLIVWSSLQIAPVVEKFFGKSFIHPVDGFYEVIYKGKTLTYINNSCVIIFFDGKDYPNEDFNCSIKISKDYEHIKYEQKNIITMIWEDGILK